MPKRKKDEKVILPEYDGTPGDEAFKEFYKLHIDEKGEPTPVLKREKALKGARAEVATKTLDEVINGEINLAHIKGDNEKREAAARIVQYLVAEGYKKFLHGAHKPETAEDIDHYLKIAGIEATHDQLIQEIMSTPNLDYDSLPEESSLKKLINHIASAKNKSAKEATKLQMYLTTTKKEHPGVKKAAGELMNLNFGPGSDIGDVFKYFQGHIAEQQQRYIAKFPSPTVKPKEKEGKKYKPKDLAPQPSG